jgi:hypothetical protein
MAKIYEITFGPSDKSVTGESIADLLERRIFELGMAFERALSDIEKKSVRDSLQTQCEAEKSILIELCQTYASNSQNLSAMVDMQDVVKEIKSAVGCFTILDVDLKKIASDENFKKIEPRALRTWMPYQDLLLQIKNPKEFKKPEVTPA